MVPIPIPMPIFYFWCLDLGYDLLKVSMAFNCGACLEDFDCSVPHFTCCNVTARCTYQLCVICFANYVSSCCTHWATETLAIPLKCSLCDFPVGETVVRNLLQSEHVAKRGLWDLYQAVQIKIALQQRDVTSGEFAITCIECNHYAEICVPAPKGYWDELQSVKHKKMIVIQNQYDKETAENETRTKRKLLKWMLNWRNSFNKI